MSDGADKYARLAAQVLRTQAEEIQPEVTDGRRDKMVAVMALAIAAKRRRRRAVVVTGVVLAAAAAVALMVKSTRNQGTKQLGAAVATALVVEKSAGSGSWLVRSKSPEPLADGTRLEEGDTVQADARAMTTLGFANGTRLTLSEAGHLRVEQLSSTRRFALETGRLQAHVAKLVQNERFIVTTPDAEVEVRGTVFGVSVGADGSECGTAVRAVRSRVEVSEGAVWVRSRAGQLVLTPGQSWTSPCPSLPAKTETATPATTAVAPAPLPSASSSRPSLRHAGARPRPEIAPVVSEMPPAPLPAIAPAAPLPSAPAAPPAIVPSAAPLPAVAPAAPPPVRREPVSSLGEQNNLFSSAMADEHRGDHSAALRKLGALKNDGEDRPARRPRRRRGDD